MYNYLVEKPAIFTEQGQVDFIKVRDKVNELLNLAGAFNIMKALKPVCGDGWYMIALVDRLVELGEIRELTGPDVCGQDRVFVGKRSC